LQRHIKAHEQLNEQQQLLTSITGIGDKSAAIILAEIGSIAVFDSARQLAAFAGLTPQEFQSGSSVRGKTRLCKIGNPRLRKALYFPALVAIRLCQKIQAFRNRLLNAGKTKMQVVGAVMHKLIRVIDGVLKSKSTFRPKQACCQARPIAPSKISPNLRLGLLAANTVSTVAAHGRLALSLVETPTCNTSIIHER
jgi:transposase